jgi:hypothetical protein
MSQQDEQEDSIYILYLGDDTYTLSFGEPSLKLQPLDADDGEYLTTPPEKSQKYSMRTELYVTKPIFDFIVGLLADKLNFPSQNIWFTMCNFIEPAVSACATVYFAQQRWRKTD